MQILHIQGCVIKYNGTLKKIMFVMNNIDAINKHSMAVPAKNKVT